MSTPAFNQDDARERAMIQALNLDQRPDRARHEEDAHLDVELEGGGTVRLLFELKSAPADGDFGTGRDTGMPQLQRWSTMHFAFAWFTARDNQPKRIWYGSPAMMRQWNGEQQAYLAPDILLTDSTPELVGFDTVAQVLGVKEEYTYDDLHRLLKDQWNASARLGRENLYLANADVRRVSRATECRYSPQMALRAVRDRVRYLLARGSTVNNRKISGRYVQDHCVEITGRWVPSFDRAVREALAAEGPLGQPATADEAGGVDGAGQTVAGDHAVLAAEESLDADGATDPVSSEAPTS